MSVHQNHLYRVICKRSLFISGCCVIALGTSACGTLTPQIGEIWDDNSGTTTRDLEYQVKNKIFCELQLAVSKINDSARRDPFVQYFNGRKQLVKPLPSNWGIQMGLNFVVVENTALNPAITINDPMKPHVVYGSAVARSFNLGVGGTLSAEATRTDKYSFYYLVPDLEGGQQGCSEAGQQKFSGSSLLIESELGIYKWLNNAMNIRSSTGVSSPSKLEAFTYTVKFDIVSSGTISPSWKLVQTSINPNLPLFSTKRQRSHELSLTIGRADPPATKGAPPQPSRIAADEALAQQIGSAVGAAVRNALQN